MTPEQQVRTTYQAFNDRDEQKALAGLHPDVQWDDGQGHMLRGKQAVAKHWREQWERADAKIQIGSTEWHGQELIVRARLEIHEPDGRSASRALRNIIRFEDDLIASMQIGQ